MFQPLILSDTYVAKGYEIVGAIVIILFSLVVLFFLYRNVSKEIKAAVKERKAMKAKDEKVQSIDSIVTSEEHPSISKRSSDVIGLINQSIYHSKEGKTISVMFYMNLDNFKYIADKYSPKQVDRVISEVAKRLKKNAPKHTISGHVERDVFIYYMTGDITNQVIRDQAEELLKTISEPLKSVPEEITTSMGIVLFPFDGISAAQLIKNAEIALYVSKKEGKNRYSLYSKDLVEKEQFNLSYYQEIKKSIANDEFLLYYQPIVDVRTSRLIGMESLLRWNHPTMGILPPGKFLNIMDLTGDITWFGKWGFEKIVQQYLIWKKLYKIRDLFISTNLSPKQLMMEGLADDFYNIIKKYEFSAEQFCLEIIDYYDTIKNPVALSNLQEFRRFGFRIASDDLGDNFELIDDMQRVKANIIKISREDVLKVMNRFSEAEKIEKIIALAQQNQKVVIAEGIEDETMIQRMASLDIRFMQGYYFSEPKSVDETTKILKKNPWSMLEFSKIINR